MKIRLNAKRIEINDNTNIYELLQREEFDSHSLVVEYNFEIIPKEKWSNIVLKENDNLEVLKFIGGG